MLNRSNYPWCIALGVALLFCLPGPASVQANDKARVAAAPLLISCGDKSPPIQIRRFFVGVGKIVATPPQKMGTASRVELPLQIWYETNDQPGVGVPSYLVPRPQDPRIKAPPTAFGFFCGNLELTKVNDLYPKLAFTGPSEAIERLLSIVTRADLPQGARGNALSSSPTSVTYSPWPSDSGSSLTSLIESYFSKIEGTPSQLLDSVATDFQIEVLVGDLLVRKVDWSVSRKTFVPAGPGSPPSGETTARKEREATPDVAVEAQPQTRADIALPLGPAAVTVLAALRSVPDAVKTHGYCRGASFNDAGIVLQSCETAADGRVPVTIKGFKRLSISPGDQTAISRLETSPFEVPYPPAWKVPTNQLVRVQSFPLSAFAQGNATTVALDQGIRGCEAKVALSINDVISETVNVPSPPCVMIGLQFPKELLPTTLMPRITKGCRIEGSAAPVNVNREGKAQCWLREGGKGEIVVEWASGFQPITLKFDRPPATSEGLSIPRGELLDRLRPKWPYAGTGPFDAAGAVPPFAAQSATYQLDRERKCGDAVSIGQKTQAGSLPTLAEASCKSLPTHLSTTFKRQSGANTVPAEAFKDTISDLTQIGDANIQRDISTAKVPLDVRFTTAAQGDIEQRFAVSIRDQFSVILKVFEGDASCTPLASGKTVAISNVAAVQEKWPARAVLVDRIDNEPISDCAIAKVEQDKAGPFLAFAFKPVRAVGKRRVVVVSPSREFLVHAEQTVLDALRGLVDNLANAEKQGKALTPVTVFYVEPNGAYRLAFTGEQAALNPAETKERIVTRLPKFSPVTPLIGNLRHLPELKGLDGVVDQMLFIMDGGTFESADLDALARIKLDLDRQRANGLAMVLTSDVCDQWKRHIGDFSCISLSRANSEKDRREQLAAAVLSLAQRAGATPPK